jgi:hypothetical protein
MLLQQGFGEGMGCTLRKLWYILPKPEADGIEMEFGILVASRKRLAWQQQRHCIDLDCVDSSSGNMLLITSFETLTLFLFVCRTS